MDIPHDDGLKRYTMIPINPNDKPPIPLEKIRDDLVKQMTNMDEKEIKNMANIIVNLIKQVRDLSDSNQSKLVINKMVEKKEGIEKTCEECATDIICRLKDYGSDFEPSLQWQNFDGSAHYKTKNGKDFFCNVSVS